MGDTSLPTLRFAAIEARIHEMPDSPIAALNTPRWAVALNLIRAGGAIIGLLPCAARGRDPAAGSGAVKNRCFSSGGATDYR
jgi:hypothetical protein